MDVSTTAMIITLIITFFVWLFRKGKQRNSLPGPIGLPFVGYLPFMLTKEYPFIKLHKLKEKYGPIYSLRLGSRYTVVLSDFASIKEAFNQDAFMGRPRELPFELSKETIEKDIMTGIPWKEQRRFALHMLRDLGLGKTTMEAHIQEEIEDLRQRLQETGGEPIEVIRILTPSTSNNIASLLFGRRMKTDDPKRILLDRLLYETGLVAGQFTWKVFFPSLIPFITAFGRRHNKLSKILDEMNEFVIGEIEEHETTFSAENIRDFIDGYLLEIQKRSDDPNANFTKTILKDLSGGFFGAGSETVRISVEWLILTMATYPEVQKKVQVEIDDVIGQFFPTRKDYLRMPFSEAVILESSRWKTTVPINILRSTLEDTELNGYFIPKDSLVIANIWAVHHDPQFWGKDVDVFRPERFLSEGGKSVMKPDCFIPFSIGKRSCPGKPLAEVEVFLYFVAIMQRFSVSLPEGQAPDLDGILGISYQPKRQKFCFHIRR